jgi:citrate lyase beta subunit
MLSYFFIPASLISKIKDIESLNVDEIIIDLEDSIRLSDCDTYVKKIINLHIDKSFFIRVPLYTLENKLDLNFYLMLRDAGYVNFVFPKIKDEKDFEFIATYLSKQQQIIVLIENPLLLVKLELILEKFHENIFGIGLGSHDFMSCINAHHTLVNLEYYRNFVLLWAKAYNVHAFDIASMELKEDEKLKDEIKDGIGKGFDAKFYIHPWQIAMKNEVEMYELSDFEWANKVYKEYIKVKSEEEFEPIIVDGQIIEKPHLTRVFSILKHFENIKTNKNNETK